MKPTRSSSLLLVCASTALMGAASPPTTTGAWRELPFHFEPNLGQAPAQVAFMTRGAGYGLYLAPDEAVLAIRRDDGTVQPVRIALHGASPAARVVGAQMLEGRSHYANLLANEPWLRDVPHYAQVKVEEAWPGVDVVYYGRSGQLEYDFIVAPGADPHRIGLRIDAEGSELDENGDLLIATDGQPFIQRAPVAYQRDDDGNERPVRASFVKKDDGTWGFSLGDYDPRRALIIDPVLSYSTYLGGTMADTANGIAVDSSGNAYVTGGTTSADFPVNAYDTSHGGGYDCFVSKLNAAGTALLASTFLGNTGGFSDQECAAIAIDSATNIYLVGHTNDVRPEGDVFVLRLAATFTSQYTLVIGGAGPEQGRAIALDSGGAIYITGWTESSHTDNPPFPANALQTEYGGGRDGFAGKVLWNGSALVLDKLSYGGGAVAEEVNGVAVGSDGSIWIAGVIKSTATDHQAFVTRLTAAWAFGGNSIFGGSAIDAATGIAVQDSNIFATGYTTSTNFPATVGKYQTTLQGGARDAFLVKLDPNMTVANAPLLWATYVGAAGAQTGHAVAVNIFGQIVIAGETTELRADGDAFVATINFDGGSLIRKMLLGGSGYDVARALAVRGLDMYIAGSTASANLPTVSAYQGTYRGAQDAFVAKVLPEIASLSIANASVTEGNTGTVNLRFTVTLAKPTGDVVKVNHATNSTGRTATAGVDYTATSGTLTINPGQTTGTIDVPVIGDLLDEDNETFNIVLSNPQNASIAVSTAVGTINDNDAAPSLAINDVSVTEGTGSGTTRATFTVSLSAPSGKAISVVYQTSNGTAVAGSDYTGIGATTLNIAAGSTSATIPVTITRDAIDEPNETFNVLLSSPINATIADGTGVGTILDDDNPPTIAINDVSVTEGNTGSKNAAFTVSLSAQSGYTVTVRYATANGTAVAPGDYTAVALTTLTYSPGQTAKTVNVAVIGDVLDEENETFTVNLSSAVNASIADATGVGTILDNDNPPALSINDVSVTEGNSGTVNANFTVSLTAPSAKTIGVTWQSGTGGTATAGTDYNAVAPATLTFTAGQTSMTVTVQVRGDTIDEPNETFNVTLSGPTNATIVDATGVGTIIDDDGAPALYIDDVSVTEGNSGTVNARFTVSLAGQTSTQVTATWSTGGGTATAGTDYTAVPSATLTIPGGSTSATLDVPVAGDTLDEANETFNVTLSNPQGATLGDATGVATIVDDDPPPSVSVSNASAVAEDGTGAAPARFTVTLSAVSAKSITVEVQTADGTAVAGSDYTALATTVLTFAAGTTSKTVDVAILADALHEDDETFTLTLSNPVNAILGTVSGSATILDNDAPPALSIDDVTVTEPGPDLTAEAVFTVSLSALSGKAVTVTYETADGTAVAGEDYEAPAPSMLTFPPGTLQQEIRVAVLDDELDEDDETFRVRLSGPVAATLERADGEGLIIDDDPTPRVDLTSLSVVEGNSGTVQVLVTARLSPVSGRTVTVDWATMDGTAVAALDYVAASGTLAFSPGETEAVIPLDVVGDVLAETNETFTVVLSNPTNVLNGVNGLVTITDDEGQVLAYFATDSVSVSGAESSGGALVVELSTAPGGTVTVDYLVHASSTATLGADHDLADGTLTFEAGVTRRTLAFSVIDETLSEDDETVVVQLVNPQGVQLLTSRDVAVYTITDDDPLPELDFDPVTSSAAEAAGGAVTVRLGPASGRTVSADLRLSGGTATAADHAFMTTTVVLPAGQTSATFDLGVVDDLLDEADETLVFELANVVNATLPADATFTFTLLDDDAPPAIAFASAGASVDEGTASVRVEVVLSAPSGRLVSVSYEAVENPGALDAGAMAFATGNGADYSLLPGTLVFSPGQTASGFDLSIVDDNEAEGDEVVVLRLSSPTHATLGDPAEYWHVIAENELGDGGVLSDAGGGDAARPDGSAAGGDGGPSSGGETDAGTPPDDGGRRGPCGCQTGGEGEPAGWMAAVALLWFARRRQGTGTR